jgi:hypothetical protein
MDMSRVPFSRLLAVALAVPLFAGCTGPWKLRDVRDERTARRAADGKEGLGRASLSDESPASSRDKEAFSTRLLGEALPPVPGLDAQTDTRVRDALWKLQRENPQGCKALKRILYEQDPSIPPLMAQGLREQCVAHLLADSKSPASPASSMAACNTAIVPGTTGLGATGSGAAAVAAGAVASGSEANAATPAAVAKAQPESAAGAGSAPSPSVIALASASEPIAAKSDAPPANTAAATPEAAPASPPATSPAAAATGDSAAAKTGASDGQTTAAKETPSQHDPAADLKAGQWESEVQQAIATLEQELDRFKHDEVETARLNAMLRLLYVVANRRDQAVKPIEGMTEDEREFWKQQLYGLAVSLDAEGRHALSRRASLALRYYDTAEDHLSNLSSLDVHGLAFCTRVESFGRYEEFKSADFKPGQEVLLYVEVSHFAAETRGDQFETELQGEYEVFDKQGVRVANVALPLDKQLCNNRRRDYFIAYRLFIPKDVPAGSYTLRLTVEDVKGKKSSQSSIDFKIRG